MTGLYDFKTEPTEDAVRVLMAAHNMSEIEARFALSIIRGEREGDAVAVDEDTGTLDLEDNRSERR
jgi:hypothetical protein